MYAFGMVGLLALATFAVVRLAMRYLVRQHEARTALLLLVGIGTAWLVDFSLFREWAIVPRADWIGITLTGFAIGAVAYAYEGIYELTKGAIRMVNDQAEATEVRDLRRVA